MQRFFISYNQNYWYDNLRNCQTFSKVIVLCQFFILTNSDIGSNFSPSHQQFVFVLYVCMYRVLWYAQVTLGLVLRDYFLQKSYMVCQRFSSGPPYAGGPYPLCHFSSPVIILSIGIILYLKQLILTLNYMHYVRHLFKCNYCLFVYLLWKSHLRSLSHFMVFTLGYYLSTPGLLLVAFSWFIHTWWGLKDHKG